MPLGMVILVYVEYTFLDNICIILQIEVLTVFVADRISISHEELHIENYYFLHIIGKSNFLLFLFTADNESFLYALLRGCVISLT